MCFSFLFYHAYPCGYRIRLFRLQEGQSAGPGKLVTGRIIRCLAAPAPDTRGAGLGSDGSKTPCSAMLVRDLDSTQRFVQGWRDPLPAFSSAHINGPVSPSERVFLSAFVTTTWILSINHLRTTPGNKQSLNHHAAYAQVHHHRRLVDDDGQVVTGSPAAALVVETRRQRSPATLHARQTDLQDLRSLRGVHRQRHEPP